MTRFARVLLVAAVTFCLVTPSASSAPTSLGKTLGNLWTTVLGTSRRPITRSGAAAPGVPCSGKDRCAVRRWFVYVHRQGRYGNFHHRVDNRVQHLCMARATARPRPQLRAVCCWRGRGSHSHGHHQRRTRSAHLGRDWAADDPSAAGQHLRVEGGRTEWAVRRPRLCLPHGPADPRDVHHRRPRRVPRRFHRRLQTTIIVQ